MSSRNFSKFFQSSSLFVPLDQVFGWLHDPCLELSVEGHDFLNHMIGAKWGLDLDTFFNFHGKFPASMWSHF